MGVANLEMVYLSAIIKLYRIWDGTPGYHKIDSLSHGMMHCHAVIFFTQNLRMVHCSFILQ